MCPSPLPLARIPGLASKAGIHGHFGSKQALQLATIERARALFWRAIIQPSEAAPDGVPRLWALCTALTAYSTETGLHGGDFWVMVAKEYDARSGPVRDAVEAAMSWWMRRLEDLISAAAELGQLTPCDPAQLAFELQALLDAGGHQYRLYHDPKAPARTRTAIRQRLEHLRGPRFPALPE
jgi:AcrR family transcriptional regulator